MAINKISHHKYEVFLNFRGEDTRHGFTDHLHNALIQADIDTFLDDEKLETGDGLKPELERAIMQSQAAIIVLSKNYASSTWCLNELLMILEQRRSFGMIVLPIFYHVDPSNVRKQNDSFGEALIKHEKGIEAETNAEKKELMQHKLKLWKEALTEVAELKGKNINGWHETTFIKQIVTEIDRRLGRKVSNDSEDLLGMSLQIRTMSLWIQDGSENDVDFLVICGMGGIGKTTLALHIFDRNSGLFERSCFLENIGKISTSMPDGKLSLQKRLLKDIKGKQDISRVTEGTRKIEKALGNKQVLLVLDDVDDVDQLDMLLGKKGIRPGSKIIITTRDRLLPRKCEIWNSAFSHKNYTEILLEGLGTNESLELLSWHAFKCKSPKEGYEELSREAVRYCAGNPLALKVLGSSLFQRNVAAWEDTLKLLDTESVSGIQSVLKVSFDSLTENDKRLFKYIACFFVGKDADYMTNILKECDIKTASGIPNLIDKCLLTVESLECVEMHPLLQEMGRHMVHQESVSKPWKRSILCCHEESFKVLKEEKGSEKIQGLLLDMKMPEKKNLDDPNDSKEEKSEDHYFKNARLILVALGWIQTFISPFCWWLFGWLVLFCSRFYKQDDKGNLKTEAFTKMKNLVLLQLNYVQLAGSYEKFPISLRWLCWHGFSSLHIPSELPMANVVALDMSHSNLVRLWKTPKTLVLLKILDLSDSAKLIRTGDLSGLPNLERLILARCGNLIEICESIGKLHCLALLDIRYCVKLGKLPRSVRELKKMRRLLVEGCSNLFKPSGLEARTTKLVVPRSPQSSWSLLLPHSIVQLNLVRNNLSNESFPVDFSSLSSLVTLDLSQNPMDSLPDCVRTLVKIQNLDMWMCGNLKSVLDLPSTIRTLGVHGCDSLEKITFLPAQLELPAIGNISCNELMEAQGFFKFETIKKVSNEIIERLGWSDLGLLEHQEVITNTDHTLPSPLMLFEFGIFSTYISDNQIPRWFTYKTNGSSISFTVPPATGNYTIRGLNLYFVQTTLDLIRAPRVSSIKINNITKNLTWMYNRKIEKHNGDMVLFSHWMFGNDNLDVGDEVSVSVGESEKFCVFIKECGIELVYDDDDQIYGLQEMETDPLEYYKSWKHIINGDLSPFQCTDGSYLLASELLDLQLGDQVSEDIYYSLFSSIPRFEDEPSWEESVYGLLE